MRKKRKALQLKVVTFFPWERKNKEKTWRVLSLWDVEKKLRLFAEESSKVHREESRDITSD